MAVWAAERAVAVKVAGMAVEGVAAATVVGWIVAVKVVVERAMEMVGAARGPARVAVVMATVGWVTVSG